MIYNTNRMKPQAPRLKFDEKGTLDYIDSLKLSTKDRLQLYAVLEQMKLYVEGKISYTVLDNYMLFSGNRIKAIAWEVEARMYPNKTPMREEFE